MKVEKLKKEIEQLKRIMRIARKMQYWNVEDDQQAKIQSKLWCELYIYKRFYSK